MPTPRNARQSDRGGRTYLWPPTGENFTSVTTIQQAMAKPALVYWSARMVAEGAVGRLNEWLAIRDEQGDEAAVRFLKSLPWDRRDRAADAGSAVHAAIEAAVKGTTPPRWPKLLIGFGTQYRRFLAAYQPQWVTSEATVYSRLGYAGTLDAIARIGGRLFLLDVKSGERVYDEAAIQLAAYRYAEWIDLSDGIEHPIPAVEQCAVLHLRPDRYQLVEVEAGPAEFAVFTHLFEVYRFMEAVKARSKIGAMVDPVALVAESPPTNGAAPTLDELLVGAA